MAETPPIEDRSDLRSFLRNTTEWSFTIVMWALWIYFFLPMLSLALWIVGIPYIFKTLFQEEVLTELISLLSRMGLVVVVIFVIIRGWGIYNYHVFGKRNRRKQHPQVTPEQIGRHFGLNPDQVLDLQQQREIIWTGLYDELQKQRSLADSP